jgi:hypothetical protein
MASNMLGKKLIILSLIVINDTPFSLPNGIDNK